MARPGLEPGTPRFSGSRRARYLPAKRLQIGVVFVRASRLRCPRFRAVPWEFGTPRAPRSPNGRGCRHRLRVRRGARNRHLFGRSRSLCRELVRRSGPRPQPRSADAGRPRVTRTPPSMESRSTGGDLDSEPVLLVRSLQHLECSITRYLRLSPKPPTDACVAGCRVGVRFASASRRGDFFRLRHSVGVWVYRPHGLRHTTKH
jgi:hypothetical protein